MVPLVGTWVGRASKKKNKIKSRGGQLPCSDAQANYPLTSLATFRGGYETPVVASPSAMRVVAKLP